jgi:1,4-dihydroxy-6-naphthoate synthase
MAGLDVAPDMAPGPAAGGRAVPGAGAAPGAAAPLRLAYSPCPNDTFIFHAWVQGLLPGTPAVSERLEDIDTLNGLAAAGDADVIKVSFHAFGHLRDRYALLHSGGALGRGCGPLIVARKDSSFRPADANGGAAVLADDLSHVRIAIPGELTTGALLAGLFVGGGRKRVVMPFDRIMPAVAAGEVDAGVIIHEGRFTFGSYGLRRLVDLGEWWETTTGMAIPLGGIAVSRALDPEMQGRVDAAIRASVTYAKAHPDASRDYVASHSQEMDPAVCQAHIDLYVNDATVDYGPAGEAAIEHLLAAAAAAGLIEESDKPLFWDG